MGWGGASIYPLGTYVGHLFPLVLGSFLEILPPVTNVVSGEVQSPAAPQVHRVGGGHFRKQDQVGVLGLTHF